MTDDLTVSDIEDAVAEIDDPATLEEMRADEKAGKDRVTAIEAVDDRLDALDEKADEDDDSAPEMDAGDDDDSGDDHATPGQRYDNVRVRTPNGEGGHIAGFSFGRNEVKNIPATASVKDAIMTGKLQRVP